MKLIRDWGNVWENYFAAIGVVITLYLIYKFFKTDMIGLGGGGPSSGAFP